MIGSEQEQKTSRVRERNKKLLSASLAAILAKALSMLAPLITINVTFNYLGQDVYGLWNATSSFFALFAYADLGLGSGLATKLGRASGSGNSNISCKKLISSAYSVLFLFSATVMVLFLLVFPIIDWGNLMNAEDEKTAALVGGVVLAVVTPKIICIPLSLIQRTQIALQDGLNSYLWQCAGSILNIVLVFVICGMDLGPLTMIWASSLITVVILLLNTLFYYSSEKNKKIRPSVKSSTVESSKEILSLGVCFCALSMLTNLGLSLDNFIAATTVGLSTAASFSILYKIVQSVAAVCTLLSNNLWGANGEALARGEYGWVRNTANRMSAIFFAITFALTVGMLLFSNPVIELLVGKPMDYSFTLIAGCCVMQMLLAVISPHFMILNSAGVVKPQIAAFLIFAPVSLISKYFACSAFGIEALPWAGVVAYLLIIFPFVFCWERKVLKGFEK